MDNNITLKNKNVLVTGGGRGIGAGICRAMAACGANVVVNYYRHRENAEQLVSELKDNYHVNAWSFGADIADSQATTEMFKKIDATVGPIDILVNNAGCESVEYAVDLKLEDWDRIFSVNLRGPFVCSQEAARRMMKQNSGVIINISSIHDRVPRKGLVHYCTAKAGMNMMTKCLALEFAPFNIRVVAVSPGAIETEMNRQEIAAFGREKFNNWIPLGRVGIVEDIAWTCAFIASDKAAYYTGTEIYIDGGYKESTIPYDPRPPKSK